MRACVLCVCVCVCVRLPGRIDDDGGPDDGQAVVTMKQLVLVGCKSGTHRSDVTARCVVAQLNTLLHDGLHALH